MHDVIIIGSGPAGYTAAIYASRALLKTLVLTGPQPGGQLTTTTEVENFPGFPEGIQGQELLQNMRKQAERFGAEIVTDEVRSVILSPLKAGEESSPDVGWDASLDPSSRRCVGAQDDNKIRDAFIVQGQKTFEARAVIIATGASAKTLGIPSEEKFRGKGISYCATCDGFFFRGKHVAVLGGGDTAMEEATFLTKFASHVTIIHRRKEFRASPIMIEKAKKDPKISFLLNTVVEEFYGGDVLQGVRVREYMGDRGDKGDGGKEKRHQFDGVFVAIGHTPATEFLKGVVEMDGKGYILVCPDSGNPKDSRNRVMTQTSIPGIFAAGDCVDPHYRQAIVAAGMGCQAAIDAMKYLEHDAV